MPVCLLRGHFLAAIKLRPANSEAQKHRRTLSYFQHVFLFDLGFTSISRLRVSLLYVAIQSNSSWLIHSRFPVFTLLAYFSPLPAVIWLVKSEGFVSRSLATPFTQLVGIVSAKGSAAVKDDPRKFVVALTAFYILSVFIFSAVMSVTGQSMGNKEGYRNRGMLNFTKVCEL